MAAGALRTARRCGAVHMWLLVFAEEGSPFAVCSNHVNVCAMAMIVCSNGARCLRCVPGLRAQWDGHATLWCTMDTRGAVRTKYLLSEHFVISQASIYLLAAIPNQFYRCISYHWHCNCCIYHNQI